MNHITQQNWLEKLLKNYKDYLPYCFNDDLVKLMSEMHIILHRIEKIREMSFDDKVKEVTVQYITKQSKSNFKTK